MKRLIFLIMAIAVSVAVFADDAAQRALRRHIAEGNKAYSEKRYSDAEAAYKKRFRPTRPRWQPPTTSRQAS